LELVPNREVPDSTLRRTITERHVHSAWFTLPLAEASFLLDPAETALPHMPE